METLKRYRNGAQQTVKVELSITQRATGRAAGVNRIVAAGRRFHSEARSGNPERAEIPRGVEQRDTRARDDLKTRRPMKSSDQCLPSSDRPSLQV